MVDVRHLLGLAEYTALEAGKAIMEIYRTGVFNVTIKPDASPLTSADKAAQRIINMHLTMTGLPVLSEESGGVGYRQRKKWEYFWIVDPLDGTKEFIKGNGQFTVNIALVHKTAPIGGIIHVPANDITYAGSKETGVIKKEKGKILKLPPLAQRPHIQDLQQKERLTVVVSKSHLSEDTMEFIKKFRDVKLISMGSSLKFMALIEQQADVYPRLGITMEWDTAAAHAILNASNRGIYEADMATELRYNKPDLRNPYFVAF